MNNIFSVEIDVLKTSKEFCFQYSMTTFQSFAKKLFKTGLNDTLIVIIVKTDHLLKILGVKIKKIV